MEQKSNHLIKPHTMIAKIFHWGFIVVFAYALAKQLGSIHELADRSLLRFEIHFAIAFLVLLAARFIYMRLTRPSALPDDTSPTMRMAARLGHLAMYLSLAMIAVSGLMIGWLYSRGGSEAAGMDLALGLHEASVMASYITIGLHIAAALFHRFKGDGIWSTMVPVWTEKEK